MLQSFYMLETSFWLLISTIQIATENFNFEMCPEFGFSLQLPKLTDTSSYRVLSLPTLLRLKSREMDARVSTWKERIENALEEQDKNRPFDMGSYGEQILDTISSRTDSTGTASFGEIVCGRPKYEVVRTFSALLQLVNDRSVDLDKGQSTNELVCYTAENSFHARLIGLNQRGQKWRHTLL